MALPDSYTNKPNSIPAYFDALLHAEAPPRFTVAFLESLDFKSTNDRAFINVLKDLGFLDADSVPKDRYYEFLDRSQATRVVAEGVREAYSDLFAVKTNAHELPGDEVKNKLRTLYKGAKKDGVIGRIASTFAALCDYADFSATTPKEKTPSPDEKTPPPKERAETPPKEKRPAALRANVRETSTLPENSVEGEMDCEDEEAQECTGETAHGRVVALGGPACCVALDG